MAIDKKNSGSSKGNYKGKSSKKGNFKKSFKGDQKVSDSKLTCDLHEYTNDIAWYSKNAQLLYDAGNLPFNNPVGSEIKMEYGTGSELVYKYVLPGVHTIIWGPCPGISRNNYSPINIAARNLYSYIRQANSGAKNYDSPDLMLYLLAMDSLYALHAWMMRLYGMLRFNMPTTRYLPKVLIEANGVDYSDLNSNIAQFRYYVNSFAVRLGAYAVPNTMYYFTRHRWMSSNVYMDEPTVKPQLYMYNPAYFFQFALDGNQAGSLVPKPFYDPALRSVSSIIDYAEEMLNAIVGNEDFNIMSGDILKAYGGNIVTVPTLNEDYTVQPVYSAEVLEQIHNVNFYYDMWVQGSYANAFTVSQDPTTNALHFDPTIELDEDDLTINLYKRAPKDVLLDLKNDLPSASDTMIASRMCTPVKNDEGILRFWSAASEVCLGVNQYTLNFEGDATIPNVKITSFGKFTVIETDVETSSVDITLGKLVPLLEYGAFDRCMLTRILAINNFTDRCYTYLLGQRNNITVLGEDVLTRMHECALLSMFDVPAMGITK